MKATIFSLCDDSIVEICSWLDFISVAKLLGTCKRFFNMRNKTVLSKFSRSFQYKFTSYCRENPYDHFMTLALSAAVSCSDIELMYYFIGEGGVCSEVKQQHILASRCVDIVRFFQDNGKIFKWKTAILEAAALGDIGLCDYCISEGRKSRPIELKSAIETAVTYGYTHLTEYLLNYYCNLPNFQSKLQELLRVAVKNKNLTMITLLIGYGANAHSLMEHAASKDWPHFIDTMLQTGYCHALDKIITTAVQSHASRVARILKSRIENWNSLLETAISIRDNLMIPFCIENGKDIDFDAAILLAKKKYPKLVAYLEKEKAVRYPPPKKVFRF